MPATTLRGTPATLALVYEDVEPILDSVAAEHSARFGIPFEEARADANLHFVEAYHSHDPAQSELGQRIRYVVPRRLRDGVRVAVRRAAILARVDAEPDEMETCPEPEPYSLGALSRRIGPDARLILALVFDPPGALEFDIAHDPEPGEATIRRCIRRYARTVWEWPQARIDAAFSEISAAL